MKLFKTLVLLFAISTTVCAHVPFLKPNQFNVLHNRLQIESSFTEDPFQADFAMLSDEYFIVSASLERKNIIPSFKTQAAVYLEPQMSDSGTYRIHSALRKGPKYKGVETDKAKLYFANDTLKHKGKSIQLQYYSSADTYLTLGKSNYKPCFMNRGVEIIPLHSPNDIVLHTPTKFCIYFNGKPAPNARVVVAYDNDHYVTVPSTDLYDIENARSNNIYANDRGEFYFNPQKAGLVLLFVTIHKKINNTLWESYNNSLTLEIQLPDVIGKND